MIESTYGDREHPKEDVLAELAPALQRLAKRGGVAVIPVFAVGRAQALLHAIHQLKLRGDTAHLTARISGQPDGRAHHPFI